MIERHSSPNSYSSKAEFKLTTEAPSMKHFKARFLALGGLITLSAALLAPIATAQCPLIVVPCDNGSTTSCAGTPQGENCVYNRDCLNGGKCKGFSQFEVPDA
jgi:hypothetical protein